MTKKEHNSLLHIALVANATWNIYNFRKPLINAFIEEGWKVSVIAPVDQYIIYLDELPGVKHYHLENLDRDGRNLWHDYKMAQELRKIYQQIKPDLIIHFTHKPNLYGGWAANQGNIPSLAVVTGLGYPFLNQSWLRRLIIRFYRIAARYHRLILFENTQDCELFIQEKILVQPDQGHVVAGCGIDTEFFTPMGKHLTGEGIIFTFIGRLLYDKGTREFVEAARQVKQAYPSTRFQLIGELDQGNPAAVHKTELVDWIRQNAIEYLGFKNDVRPYIADSDCIVLPSYREAIARSLTEAMSMEKPVIATDVPGCNEIVDHDINGLLVPVKDPQSLANAMIKIIQMPENLRARMGKAGREKIIKNYSNALVSGQYLDLIHQLRFTQ
ncbi:MAG: glycosyltransferase family 4 protein [Saprospiraceae bacterium]|nr:glycosyltransferase family 4 protein [Saprospiraceae bacterium]